MLTDAQQVPPALSLTYLGPAGTFTEQALRLLPEAASARILPAASVAAAFAAVRGGSVHGAVVPLENSVEGAVGATLDELAFGTPLQLTREVSLPVVFGAYGRSDTRLDQVRTVATHPHAEAQCREWVRRFCPDAIFVPTASTADAARGVRDRQHDLAICAALAGIRYELVALASDIADQTAGMTRFVLIRPPGVLVPRTGHDRTSLVAFLAHDRVGALVAMLSEFASRGINLTRIESRPTKERLGRYCFFVDCAGHRDDPAMRAALAGVHRVSASVRILGSYPRAEHS